MSIKTETIRRICAGCAYRESCECELRDGECPDFDQDDDLSEDGIQLSEMDDVFCANITSAKTGAEFIDILIEHLKSHGLHDRVEYYIRQAWESLP